MAEGGPPAGRLRRKLASLRRHPLLATAFALAAALAVWLLAAVAWDVAHWGRPAREPIEPWMTVGYVGRSRNVDPRLIDEAAGLPTPEVAGRPLTLREVAARRGVPVAEVIAEVKAALAELGGHEAGGRERERRAP